MAKARNKEKETEAAVAVEVQELATVENTGADERSPLADAIDRLADYLVSHGFERPPDWQVVDVVIEMLDGFYARLAELDPPRAAPSAPPDADKDRVAEAYGLFRKSHAEADLPAWAELDLHVQELWRDGYNHVAGGGAPRTDYEHAVKYLITSAQ